MKKVRFLLQSTILLTWLVCTVRGSDNVQANQPLQSQPTQVPGLPQEVVQLPTMDNFRFEHISIEEGLSQSTVNAMLQDQNGFLWFATQDGLNRYDGYDFEIFQSIPGEENSLRHNFILSLAEDSRGNLWIGTNGFGLDKFDPRQKKFTHYQSTNANQPINGEYILTLFSGSDGTLWAGTEHGLSKYDAITDQFLSIDPVNDQIHTGISKIYEDHQGLLWLATHEEGPAVYNPQDASFTLLFNEAHRSDESLIHIESIMEDEQGLIWFATSQGILIYHPASKIFTDFPGTPETITFLQQYAPKSLLQDRSGIIWIGTKNGGLILYDPVEKSVFSFTFNHDQIDGLNNDTILSMLEDISGNLWFGTYSTGVNLLNRFAAPMEIFQTNAVASHQLSDNMIWSIASDPYGNIWVGTNNGGINQINLNNQTIASYSSDMTSPIVDSDTQVEALLFSSQHLLWAGTKTGILTRYNPLNGESVQFVIGRKIHTIFEDANHTLWLGASDNKLISFDPKREFIQSYDLVLNDTSEPTNWGIIYSIRQDTSGTLWIGSNTGLYAMDLQTMQIKRHKLQLEPNNNPERQSILSILITQDMLWLGSFGEGLIAYYPQSGEIKRYNMQDGLPNNVIYGILDDEYGRLWLSTNKGLSCFEPKTETFINYDVNDGLQSNEFNSGAYAKGETGELLFGGINGLNRFFPQYFRTNPSAPPIALTELSVNGESLLSEAEINNQNPLVLKWPNNNFEFEFVALNYIQPEENQYAYKLENFNEDWVYIGNRRYGQFTNLPGGNYTLRLKGSNNDEVWNENGLAIQIRVIPPYWQTWWFVSLMVLLTGSMIIGLYRIRTRSIQANNLRLEWEVQERTSELMEINQRLKNEIHDREKAESELSEKAAEAAVTNERNRLARELHDAVTQSLYGVNLYAEAASRMLAAGKLVPTAENITELQKSAREALQEMRLLIYELRPCMLVKGGLVYALENRLDSVEKRVGIVYDLKHNLTKRLPAQYELSLYRIAQESLNNILKHAQATLILIRIWDQYDRINLKIQDNGVGFNPMPTSSNGGMGLKIMKERVEHLGGEFQLISSPGKGTTILVEVIYDTTHTIVDRG